MNINFNFFFLANFDVKYIIDFGMKNLGGVMVVLFDIWKGKDREIVVSMYFGGIEIIVVVYDVISGNIVEIKIDFLYC